MKRLLISVLEKVKQFTAFRWWLSAVLLFWCSIVLITFIDYAGARWVGYSWLLGADLFPNMVLGIPLALLQIIAAALLLIAGLRLYLKLRGSKGGVAGIGMVLSTGTICFFVYVYFAFWYLVEVMQRSL